MNPPSGAEVAKLVGEGRLTSSSLPLLGMGRDTPDGRIILTDGELDVEWTTATSEAYFAAMRGTMREISERSGRAFPRQPAVVDETRGHGSSARRRAHGPAHPRRRRRHWGEAFGHPGLFVIDGSSVPGPVGPNPSLTIAAIADRAAEHLLEKPRAPTALPRPRAAAAVADAAAAAPVSGRGMEFTEEMKGFRLSARPTP